MALNATRLKNAIKAAYVTAQAVDTNREDGLEAFAAALATAIVDEIKELQITYVNGLTAGATPVTGTFNDTLT